MNILARTLPLAAVIGLGVWADAAASGAPRPSVPPGQSVRAAAPSPGGAVTRRSFPSASYTLVDVGNPSQYGFNQFSGPITINDADDMAGDANSPYGLGPPVASTRCIVFSGSAFVDVTPHQDNTCVPSTGISDPQNGAFKVGGYLGTPTIGPVAFLASVSGTSVKTTVYSNYLRLYSLCADTQGRCVRHF